MATIKSSSMCHLTQNQKHGSQNMASQLTTHSPAFSPSPTFHIPCVWRTKIPDLTSRSSGFLSILQLVIGLGLGLGLMPFDRAVGGREIPEGIHSLGVLIHMTTGSRLLIAVMCISLHFTTTCAS